MNDICDVIFTGFTVTVLVILHWTSTEATVDPYYTSSSNPHGPLICNGWWLFPNVLHCHDVEVDCLLPIHKTPSVNALWRSMPIDSKRVSSGGSVPYNEWNRRGSLSTTHSNDRGMIPTSKVLVDRHWDQCQNFNRHWSELGIDRGSPVSRFN